MTFRPLASRLSPWEHDDDAVARWLTEGGDERIALDAGTGCNLYGCDGRPWTGGLTFSSTTASPLDPQGLAAAQAQLAALPADAPHADAARAVRRQLAALCGLPTEGPEAVDIVLAPSGTDLHRIAAALAGAGARGGLTTVMPDPVESGRGVERAVRGLAYAERPPFARLDSDPLPPTPGRVLSVALRLADGGARPSAEVDAEIAEACDRAVAAGGPALLVLLDVAKTGLAAPTPACAAELKARHGERLTVLVDACQFRLGPAALREHLAQGFLVALTGSKFLGGPPFSGALLVPAAETPRLRAADLPWRALECSAREDWPEAYAGRALLPSAFSLGPALRWAPALANLAALAAVPSAALADFVEHFAAGLADRVAARAKHFEALAPAQPVRSAAGWDARATVFPLLLKRDGRRLDAQATSALYLRLRELAAQRDAGHLWIGQPVVVGAADGAPLAAVRLALSAPQLALHVRAPGGCERLLAEADACLIEIARLLEDA